MSRKRRPAAEMRRADPARSASEPTKSVLLVQPDAAVAASLRDRLGALGCTVAVACDFDAASARLGACEPAILMIDVGLARSADGADLQTLMAARLDLVCVTTGRPRDRQAAIAAMRRGAYDHYDTTAGLGELEAILRRCFEKCERERTLRELLADSDGREQALVEARAAAERAAQEARTAHAHLVEVFEAVPEGLVLFDAQDRLVLWNRRYAEICNLAGDRLAVGMRFEDLLRERLLRDEIPGSGDDHEAWLADRLARHRAPTNTHEQELPGNHWLRIEERRTIDGGNIGVRIDITELKRREASFRLLFENNPLPMWIYDHETLRFLAVNDAVVTHYGYSREQFLRMTLLDIRPREDWDLLREASRAENPHSDGGRTWRHYKADGTAMEVNIFSRSIAYEGRAARLVAVVDVTSSRRAEEELRRTREFLNTVIETVPAVIAVKDARDLTYVLVNRAFERHHGISREDMIGKTAREIFAAPTAEMIEAYDRQALESRAPFADTHTVETAAGPRIVTSTRVLVLGDDGEPRYLVIVIHDITELRQAEAKVAHMAYHDALTQLPNRAAFNERFAAALARAERNGESLAVMCLDLDRLKETNDVFGHALGDELLRVVSRRLSAASDGAFLARLGGDEFALIYEHARPAECAALAQRLLASVADQIEIENHKRQIGLSIGVAIFPNDGADAASLFSNADAALYRAKAEGRGSVRFFEADMDKRLRERRALVHDLRSAIGRNELVAFYQPQARIGGEVIGFEALARWRHPTRGLVLPGTFIPIAEESGLILAIGESILRQACHEASSWPRPLNISVNLSPAQFRHGDLSGLVHSVLLESGLAPHRLELEVTESVLIDDFARAASVLRRLKALGVRIAIDDFGTGYSSLLNLQSLPLDKIKIDRAFIANVDHNPQAATIVRAVIGLARGLGLPVLAEGVETEAQQAFLACEACDEMQGYLIGRPGPIEDHAGLLGRHANDERRTVLAG